jgi:hypothetical protein
MPTNIVDVTKTAIVGPGVTYVRFYNAGTGVDSDSFFFYYCEVAYGIQPEIIVPANTTNPMFIFKEPVGKASFVEAMVEKSVFQNLLNPTVNGTNLTLEIYNCSVDSGGGGGAGIKKSAGITLMDVYPIEAQMKFDAGNFLFLRTLIFLFFRLDFSQS